MSAARAMLYGGVLIGGRSSRMGRPKHLLPFDGRTLLARAVGALQPHVERVVLSGAGDVPAGFDALPRTADAIGQRGPLAGMLGAMAAFPAVGWVFVACDLPHVTPAAVAWVIAQRAPGRIAVLPRSANGRIEPLLALYEPAAREPLEALARRRAASTTPSGNAEKGIGPRLLAERSDVATPTVPGALAACWTSINTPEDWAGLRAPGAE